MNTTTTTRTRHADEEVRWGSVAALLAVTAMLVTAIMLAYPTERPAPAAAPAAAPAPAVAAPVAENVPTAMVDEVVLENLQVAGHEVDYDGTTGEWTVDGTVVGWSAAEDENFRAVAMLEVIRQAQP